MCEACDLVALPWLLRRAIGFVNDLELLDDEEVFQTKLKAAGVLDIVETYPWSGAEVQHKRRDKRKGSHRGRVVSTPAGPSIQISWGGEFSGSGSDTFSLEGSMTLNQQTEVTLDSGKGVSYRTVYRKAR